MTGLVCLQGGGEFGAGCRPLDARVVRRVSGGPRPVRVVVLALAAAVGAEHDLAAAGGVEHYRRLGADAVAAPDARLEAAEAVAALRQAELIVLAGGSPSRLLGALRDTPVGEVLCALADRGIAVSGSSAGAMVLCDWTVLPDQRGDAGLAVVAGLGLVRGLAVVPHWGGGGSRGDWLRALRASTPPGTVVLGLPEESGALVEGRRVLALGRAALTVVETGQTWTPGSVWELPELGSPG